jgi:hypothetical protein
MPIHGGGNARSELEVFLGTGTQEKQKSGNDEELRVGLHAIQTAHFLKKLFQSFDFEQENRPKAAINGVSIGAGVAVRLVPLTVLCNLGHVCSVFWETTLF